MIKQFRSWDGSKPARVWGALLLLSEFAPGLAPAPLRRIWPATREGTRWLDGRGWTSGWRLTPIRCSTMPTVTSRISSEMGTGSG